MIEKSQQIRLIDVFVIAPFLVYTGVKYKKSLPSIVSNSLIVLGVLTAVYNGNNYLKNRK
jgi:hypothetical protein